MPVIRLYAKHCKTEMLDRKTTEGPRMRHHKRKRRNNKEKAEKKQKNANEETTTTASSSKHKSVATTTTVPFANVLPPHVFDMVKERKYGMPGDDPAIRLVLFLKTLKMHDKILNGPPPPTKSKSKSLEEHTALMEEWRLHPSLFRLFEYDRLDYGRPSSFPGRWQIDPHVDSRSGNVTYYMSVKTPNFGYMKFMADPKNRISGKKPPAKAYGTKFLGPPMQVVNITNKLPEVMQQETDDAQKFLAECGFPTVNKGAFTVITFALCECASHQAFLDFYFAIHEARCHKLVKTWIEGKKDFLGAITELNKVLPAIPDQKISDNEKLKIWMEYLSNRRFAPEPMFSSSIIYKSNGYSVIGDDDDGINNEKNIVVRTDVRKASDPDDGRPTIDQLVLKFWFKGLEKQRGEMFDRKDELEMAEEYKEKYPRAAKIFEEKFRPKKLKVYDLVMDEKAMPASGLFHELPCELKSVDYDPTKEVPLKVGEYACASFSVGGFAGKGATGKGGTISAPFRDRFELIEVFRYIELTEETNKATGDEMTMFMPRTFTTYKTPRERMQNAQSIKLLK